MSFVTKKPLPVPPQPVAAKRTLSPLPLPQLVIPELKFTPPSRGNQVSVIVTTFLRDGNLMRSLELLARNFKGVKIVVVDDGRMATEKAKVYFKLKESGHTVIVLPFDSGLPAKRNAAVRACTTSFFLMASDDFEFTEEAFFGVGHLQLVMNYHSTVDVASGRVNNNPYEGFFRVVDGEYIKEERLVVEGLKPFHFVDITVNYFLGRTSSLTLVPWDERMKIGGEHGDWFLELKHRGLRVAWVPGVSISESPRVPGNAKDYDEYRARAWELGHAIFLQKRNVRTHFGFDSVPNRPLIAIVSCDGNAKRRNEIRATWAKQAKGAIDFKFFRGGSALAYEEDEVVLPCPDDYEHLALKVQEICRWAQREGYTMLFKVDDDSKVNVGKLLANLPKDLDYVGRKNHSYGGYCSGGPGVWLSYRSMSAISGAEWNGDPADDRWIGQLLASKGIELTESPLYVLDTDAFQPDFPAVICRCKGAVLRPEFPAPPPPK